MIGWHSTLVARSGHMLTKEKDVFIQFDDFFLVSNARVSKNKIKNKKKNHSLSRLCVCVWCTFNISMLRYPELIKCSHRTQFFPYSLGIHFIFFSALEIFWDFHWEWKTFFVYFFLLFFFSSSLNFIVWHEFEEREREAPQQRVSDTNFYCSPTTEPTTMYNFELIFFYFFWFFFAVVVFTLMMLKCTISGVDPNNCCKYKCRKTIQTDVNPLTNSRPFWFFMYLNWWMFGVYNFSVHQRCVCNWLEWIKYTSSFTHTYAHNHKRTTDCRADTKCQNRWALNNRAQLTACLVVD